MRVIYPHTRRHPEVVASAPGAALWADVSADNDAYWRALTNVWLPDDDLMVVEHDVVIHDTVISQFLECPEVWCLFGYADMCHEECREAWANMTGCTRYRKELIEACPEALSGIPEKFRDWHNLCDSIAGNKEGGMPAPLRPGSLRAAGFTHHWHTPYVPHHPWGIEENDRRLDRD